MITTAQSSPPRPRVQLMTVTPEQALDWLERMNNNNRPLSETYAQRLARDMRAGRWVVTHEGIAFDPQGVLLDGQHRLWAVALAEVPVRMHVWFDVTPESLMVINNGKPRSLADNLKLSGNNGSVSIRDLATLRAMLGKGAHDGALTAHEAGELLTRHQEAIAFAVEQLARVSRAKGISTGETRAVIGRAWYSADRQRLAEFCRVLRTSVGAGDPDQAAILLRTYLTTSLGGSRKLRLERYRKTERALRAFLRGEQLTRLYAAGSELFPLPEEIAAQSANPRPGAARTYVNN